MGRSYQGTCPKCGEVFLSGYPYRIYCSPECRQEAASQRMRNRRPLPPARPQRQTVQATRSEPAAGGLEVREWHGTPIQRRSTDGWVNATAMCQAGGRRWNDYIRLDRTSEYVCALQHAITGQTRCAAAVAGNPATLPAVTETRQGGAAHLQGTWIHPRLAIDLARWISPAFAVWMDGWFLESLAPALQPVRQPLEPGVHVVAASQRGAAMIWHEVVTAEVNAALARLSPRCRTNDGLPVSHHYTFTPATGKLQA